MVSFRNGTLTLHGVLYRPEGAGPFPAVVYNHGSGKDYTKQFEALGPLYNSRGYPKFVTTTPWRSWLGIEMLISKQFRAARASKRSV